MTTQQEQMMNPQWKLIGLATLGATALANVPAYAQVESHSQEVSAYAGQLFGDKLTDTAISGQTPELDDDFTYGFRYAFNLTPNLALEAAVGETLSSATRLAGGDIDLDLSTLDLDAVWHFNPGDRVVAYALGGVGYARANLDAPITGTVNGQPVSIDDDQGFTLNAGAGAKFYVNDRFLLRLEARYRYLDGVLESHDDALNTVETTLGAAWQF
jgi:outer membrane beta-barrel protein